MRKRSTGRAAAKPVSRAAPDLEPLGADDTSRQADPIRRAAIAGLNQELQGFPASHWRGNGEENRFF